MTQYRKSLLELGGIQTSLHVSSMRQSMSLQQAIPTWRRRSYRTNFFTTAKLRNKENNDKRKPGAANEERQVGDSGEQSAVATLDNSTSSKKEHPPRKSRTTPKTPSKQTIPAPKSTPSKRLLGADGSDDDETATKKRGKRGAAASATRQETGASWNPLVWFLKRL